MGDFQISDEVHNSFMQMNFIANQSAPALAGQTIDVLDPSDGQALLGFTTLKTVAIAHG
eukprot:gene26906-33555_t